MGWSGGLAEWDVGDTTYLSVAFTWLLDAAAIRAIVARGLGRHVVAGGPALFLVSMRHELADVAEVPTKTRYDEKGRARIVGGDYPEAVTHHNPDATFASRGCPGMGTEENPKPCSFCIVPPLEGTKFTLIPDFVVRPVLCDNNLSALPVDYQTHIIRRYLDAGVPLRDANSGFEPKTFTPDVYARWKPLINAGKGPWRFGYDSLLEREQCLAVMRMLVDEPAKRKRVYVMIGNEPVAECMQRIQEVLDHGCEPHVQPEMKLSALEKRVWVKHDWTEFELRNVARWANGGHCRMLYAEFDRKFNRSREQLRKERYDATQGLFV